MDRQDKRILGVALSIIGIVLTCATVFYGTIVLVVAHFIRKFW
jgi:hypothetical protein